jgi:hypothetical protein
VMMRIVTGSKEGAGKVDLLIMHSSKLPLPYWFKLNALVDCHQEELFGSKLQGQPGHKRYQSIWEMLHKSHCMIYLRDARHDLFGTVELDECFFSTTVEWEKKEEKSYKCNRRYFSERVFDRLLLASSSGRSSFKHRIY